MSYRPINDSKTNIPEERVYRVSLTGASTSDPTKRTGPGVTVTRTAQGVLKLAFTENPGTFVGLGSEPVFRADTPSGVKGYTCNATGFTAPSGSTAGYLSLYLWDASQAAVDLTTTQYLDVTLVFVEAASLP